MAGPAPTVTTPPPEASSRRPLTAGATAFALFLAALWGGNPVAIKAGLDDAPPLRLAGFRFVAVDLAGIQSGAFTLPLVSVSHG